MSSIEGGGQTPEKPSEEGLQAYKQDFKESIGVFRGALNEYSETDSSFYAKQDTLKESMGQSKEVMDQLSPLFNQDIQKQKAKLDTDFSAFQKEGSPANVAKLQEDLNGLDSSF